MKENLKKEEFSLFLFEENECLLELLLFHKNTFIPTLIKFDGKMYSKRFTNALRENISNRLEIKELQRDYIIIESRGGSGIEQMYAKIVLDNGRIDAEKSIADPVGQRWVKNVRDALDTNFSIIQNLDKLYAEAEKLDNAIRDWGELPWRFRRNFDIPKVY